MHLHLCLGKCSTFLTSASKKTTRPPSNSTNELPVLAFLFEHMSESPNDNNETHSLGDLTLLHDVLLAGDKYDMEYAGALVQDHLRENWTSYSSNPLHLYAFVLEKELVQFHTKAYKETLTFDINDDAVSKQVDLALPRQAASFLRARHRDRKLIMDQMWSTIGHDVQINANVAHPACRCGALYDGHTNKQFFAFCYRIQRLIQIRPLPILCGRRNFGKMRRNTTGCYP